MKIMTDIRIPIPRDPTSSDFRRCIEPNLQQWILETTADIIARGEFKVKTGDSVITAEGDHFIVTKKDGQRIVLK